MVSVRGNCSGGAASTNLREIKLPVAGIGASDKDAAYGVAGAMPECSVALLKETRILAQYGRKNRAGHEVLDGAIAKGCSETLSIALGALSVARFAVFSLADASQSGVPGNLDVVESATGHYFEFLPHGEQRNLPGIFQRQKVWQREKEAILRGALGRIGGLLLTLGVFGLVGWLGLRGLRLLRRGWIGRRHLLRHRRRTQQPQRTKSKYKKRVGQKSLQKYVS